MNQTNLRVLFHHFYEVSYFLIYPIINSQILIRFYAPANGTIETLYRLDLSSNQLSAQILDCWSHFKSLTCLNLSYNNFSGKIPTSLGSLLELQTFLLRSNDLTDEISFSLRNCKKLVMLDIAENILSGLKPTWIGSELQELQFLSLGS